MGIVNIDKLLEFLKEGNTFKYSYKYMSIDGEKRTTRVEVFLDGGAIVFQRKEGWGEYNFYLLDNKEQMNSFKEELIEDLLYQVKSQELEMNLDIIE